MSSRAENFAAGTPTLEKLLGFANRPGAGLIKASTKIGKIPRVPGATKIPKSKLPTVPKAARIPKRVTN